MSGDGVNRLGRTEGMPGWATKQGRRVWRKGRGVDREVRLRRGRGVWEERGGGGGEREDRRGGEGGEEEGRGGSKCGEKDGEEA